MDHDRAFAAAHVEEQEQRHHLVQRCPLDLVLAYAVAVLLVPHLLEEVASQARHAVAVARQRQPPRHRPVVAALLLHVALVALLAVEALLAGVVAHAAVVVALVPLPVPASHKV